MKHYVYKLTELDTGCYYIGLRSNKDPETDEYMGSYKTWEPEGKIKKDILIILPSRKMAAIVERSIIEENIDNNLCMNDAIPSIKLSANQLGSKVKTATKSQCEIKSKVRILQYTLEGGYLREWTSVSVAAECVGVQQPSLSAVLRSKNRSCAGYLWKYKDSNNIEKNIKPRTYTLINQYDLDGNFIKQWNGLMKIEEKEGYKNPNIVSCCKGRNKTAYGYNWEYANK